MDKEKETIKRGPGRPEGSTGKRNQEVYHLAEKHGVNVVEIKILLAGLQLAKLGYTEEQIESLTVSDLIDIQSRNTNDLLPYWMGKRKPIDSNGEDSLDPISDLINELRGE